MGLPKFNTEDQSLSYLQTRWASALDPLLNSPIATPVILSGVQLVAGQTVINHKLGKNLTGWEIIRQRGNANIWDNQDANPLPSSNLWLMSTSGINIDLLVF